MIEIIAIIAMLLDHIGSVFFPDIIIFRIIGRLAFPLFAWGIARGYKYTKDLKRYVIRLLLFAVVSQYPYYFLLRNGNLNIGFTLLAGLIVLWIYNSYLTNFIKCFIILSIIVLSQFLHFEYSFYGIFTIFIFYRYWEQEKTIYYQFILTLVSILILRYDPIQLISSFSTLIVLVMNLACKKDIRISKLFRYGFYPVHLLVLLSIKNIWF